MTVRPADECVTEKKKKSQVILVHFPLFQDTLLICDKMSNAAPATISSSLTRVLCGQNLNVMTKVREMEIHNHL